MNYIQRLREENTLLKECILTLKQYLELPKFNWPDNYVNTEDIKLRIREYENKLHEL